MQIVKVCGNTRPMSWLHPLFPTLLSRPMNVNECKVMSDPSFHFTKIGDIWHFELEGKCNVLVSITYVTNIFKYM